MTFEEYCQKISNIHDQLQSISDKTLNQALTGCAEMSNPAFVELMERHIRLTKLSTELTERMVSQMKIGP
jgi:DNA-binding transcriptional regulator YbjK